MANYGIYATFEEVREYLHVERKIEPNDDQRLKRFCVDASRMFDTLCNRKFYPRYEQRLFDHPPAHFDDSVLRLDDDLLEVDTFTTNNTNTTVSSSDYFLTTGRSYNHPPYDRICLDSSGSQPNLAYGNTVQQANAVTGFWGYHEDWDNAWQQIDTVQDDPLLVGGTTLTVADADGVDEVGLTPRFKVGQLLRFGTGASAEYAFVTGKNTEANTLTIVRGVNGTTAAEQAQTTDIYVYRPQDEIVLALLVLSTYVYRRKETVGGADDRGVASSTGLVLMPGKLPDEVKQMLSRFIRGKRNWSFR